MPCLSMLLVLALLANSAAMAAEYYVDPDKGADANDGSIRSPWRHLSHAGRRLQPGDTVSLRGGTYQDDSLFTTRDGTQKAPITIRAYPGEKAVISGKGIYDQVVHLNHDYYVLSGLAFENTRCYNVIYVNSSEHNTIRDCRFLKQSGTMILIRGGGYHTVEKSTFDTTGSPEGPGRGDHIYVAGSHHNLIQDNHFTRAGHAACDQIESGDDRSHHNILRNNLVEQHWGGGFYVIRGSYRSLLEKNRIYYAGREMEYPKAAFQLAADDNIVRFNVVAETGARPHSHHGMVIAGYRFSGIDQHARNNATYHNVFYKVGRAAVAVSQKQACRVTGNKTFNNIIYHGRVGGPEEAYWPDGNYYFTFETYHAFAGNKWKAFPNDNFFHHNLILHADRQGDHPGEDPIVYYEPENWGRSLARVEKSFPRHFFKNIEQNPRFADADGRDFRLLADSPAVDRGETLTRTTAPGQDTPRVPVTDASLFCDGWGRIEGDPVQVGANPPRRLLNADYEANVLVLDSPVSFAENTPVSLPYRGAAPDIGAFEFSPRQRIGFLGDSITDGHTYPQLVRQAIAEAGLRPPLCINAGIGGDTARGMRARLDRDVLARRPTLVTFSAGINDVLHGVKPEDYEADAEAVARRLDAEKIPLLILTTSILGPRHAEAEKRLAAYNASLRRIAGAHGCRLAEVNKVMREARAAGRDLMETDHVHPNWEGQRLIARAVLDALDYKHVSLPDQLKLELMPGVIRSWQVRAAGDDEPPLDERSESALRPDDRWRAYTLPEREPAATWWLDHERRRGFALSLERLVGPGKSYLAMASIEAEKPRRVRFDAGAHLQTIWLNGQRIYRNEGWKGWHVGRDRVPATLRAGTNRLVIETGGPFFVSVTDLK